MTHDFAKKPKATKRKKTAAKKQIPGWVWLFIGIVAGIFVSFLGYLANITPEPAREKMAEKLNIIKEDVKKTTATKFDFYTLLPEREVIVPIEQEEVDNRAQRDRSAAAAMPTGSEPNSS